MTWALEVGCGPDAWMSVEGTALDRVKAQHTEIAKLRSLFFSPPVTVELVLGVKCMKNEAATGDPGMKRCVKGMFTKLRHNADIRNACIGVLFWLV